MKRNFIKILIVSSIMAIISILPNTLIDTGNKPLNVFICWIILVCAFLLIEFVNKKYGLFYSNFDKMQSILNGCLKRKIHIIALSEYFKNAKESNLSENSEVHLITNDIRNFDLTEVAIEVIAKNVWNNIKYLYYIPNNTEMANDYNTLIEKVTKNIKLKNPAISTNLLGDIIQRNLKSIILPDEHEFLYNFCFIVSPNNKEIASAWYVTNQDFDETDCEKDNHVLMNYLSSHEKYELQKILDKLKSIHGKDKNRY